MDDSDDPYRVVLFDDIRPFLFVLHSADSKLQLAYAFLTFLGLPFVPPDYPTSTPFTTDSFIHSELVERPSLVRRYWPKLSTGGGKPFQTVGGEAMELERTSALGAPWETPFGATPAAVDLLFGTSGGKAGWFRTLRKEDLEDVDVELARCVLLLFLAPFPPVPARDEGVCSPCLSNRNAFSLLRSAVPDPFLTLDFFAFEAAQNSKR